MTDRPLTVAEARARMKAKKARKPGPRGLRNIAHNVAKADQRARRYIDRWLAGETQKQIADSAGITKTAVSRAIEKYRKRHPDAGVPKRKSPTKRGE